ncbi:MULTISPECIES: AAA family ATPase [unclassified Spirosoma]|uniref:AAA family ATPase n=1 Tax=unclassified Spirosoma TaxID=2621999 RepID=UPI000967A51B|nr:MULTISPECIES: AAA family ATPase [unclassified Spirosoma]MBN8825801.1 AAA family ATPase [Spirosoma sp.]OJW74392.1 MAG: hypothetical protein BGO59_19385 [Spirosoma sp. 48-14]
MDNFINYVEINNFKSIRHLELSDFKRINLFIGRPNVGKSNLLEALSLFSLPYLWENSPRKLTEIIRLESQRELFYEGDTSKGISIRVGLMGIQDIRENCHIDFNRQTGGLNAEIFVSRRDNNKLNFDEYRSHSGFSPDSSYIVQYTIDQKFKLSDYFGTESRHFINYIKRYEFSPRVKYKELKIPFLQPPFGSNMLYVLELMPKLKEVYAQWFRQYGLRLVSDLSSQSLKILKDKGDEVFLLPYSSIADTLQRIIFYKTAVASNENSVLLFEEPEAHAYPPYIAEFTQEVIRSVTNQFFIVTHSPLIVNDFLEGSIDDLAIFMVDFKDGQTVAKPLTRDEIKEVHQYGVDLFFNNEAYLS